MENINQTLVQIIRSLDNIEKRLTVLEQSQSSIQTNCLKMSNHITFIEHTYELVRKPLSYIKTKFDTLTGNTHQELPEIKTQIKIIESSK
jgi:uncharacterized coiled-coil protein SlyX